MSKKNTEIKARNSGYSQQLKTLGLHCKKIRVKKGYSIDRLSKESDELSTSVIQRLETGSGAVTIVALLRYAKVLKINIDELLNFDKPLKESLKYTRQNIIALDSPFAIRNAFKTMLPLYSLRAAAGYFGSAQPVEPEGWIDVSAFLSHEQLSRDMFVAQAVGDSMEPKIKDSEYLVFKANPVGTRNGKTVLVQYRGPADPDTGGSFTVKEYRSSKTIGVNGEWTHTRIHLVPLNPQYETIEIPEESAQDFNIIAEFVQTLRH